MCIIAVAKNRKITAEEFKKCFNSNSDGFGMAWREENKVCYQKGMMTLDEALSFYENKEFGFPHVLHFRIGTSGGKTKELTHPFIIDENSTLAIKYSGNKSLLFHNGVISDWNKKFINYLIASNAKPKGAVSDTRAIAMIISKMGADYLRKENIDRFVVFNAKETRLWGRWEVENGALFSNYGYKPYFK